MLLMVALPACKSSQHDKAPTGHVFIPDAPSQPVLDLAGVLSDSEEDNIASRLAELNATGMTQVAVVTVNHFGGLMPLAYATRVANTWGVGHKDTNDGIMIMVKPRTGDRPAQRGHAVIATGRGMEETLTNKMCDSIVNNIMIPAFKQDGYATGINHAVDFIEKFLKSRQ